jgi:hypothetical protein
MGILLCLLWKSAAVHGGTLPPPIIDGTSAQELGAARCRCAPCPTRLMLGQVLFGGQLARPDQFDILPHLRFGLGRPEGPGRVSVVTFAGDFGKFGQKASDARVDIGWDIGSAANLIGTTNSPKLKICAMLAARAGSLYRIVEHFGCGFGMLRRGVDRDRAANCQVEPLRNPFAQRRQHHPIPTFWVVRE